MSGPEDPKAHPDKSAPIDKTLAPLTRTSDGRIVSPSGRLYSDSPENAALWLAHQDKIPFRLALKEAEYLSALHPRGLFSQAVALTATWHALQAYQQLTGIGISATSANLEKLSRRFYDELALPSCEPESGTRNTVFLNLGRRILLDLYCCGFIDIAGDPARVVWSAGINAGDQYLASLQNARECIAAAYGMLFVPTHKASLEYVLGLSDDRSAFALEQVYRNVQLGNDAPLQQLVKAGNLRPKRTLQDRYQQEFGADSWEEFEKVEIQSQVWKLMGSPGFTEALGGNPLGYLQRGIDNYITDMLEAGRKQLPEAQRVVLDEPGGPSLEDVETSLDPSIHRFEFTHDLPVIVAALPDDAGKYLEALVRSGDFSIRELGPGSHRSIARHLGWPIARADNARKDLERYRFNLQKMYPKLLPEDYADTGRTGRNAKRNPDKARGRAESVTKWQTKEKVSESRPKPKRPKR